MYLIATVVICGAIFCASLAHATDSQENKNPVFILKTDMGDVTIRLFADKAPVSVENFRQYAKSGHYNGTIFHRIIKDFMIQGGGFTAELDQKPTQAPIKNEAANGLRNKRGTLAMARTGVVDSATSQFFINVVDNPFLDYKGNSPSQFGYAVFGEVINGMDVVDAIRAVPTGSKKGYQDVPLKAVILQEVVEQK